MYSLVFFGVSQDMVALDESLARPFEALKDAVQSPEAFEGLLEIECLPASTSTDDYISYMVRSTAEPRHTVGCAALAPEALTREAQNLTRKNDFKGIRSHQARATIEVYRFLAIWFSERRWLLDPKSSEKKNNRPFFLLQDSRCVPRPWDVFIL